jgi:hypothetical protein
MIAYGYYRHHLLDVRWHENLISADDKDELEEYLYYEGQLHRHIAKCTVVNCPCHEIPTINNFCKQPPISSNLNGSEKSSDEESDVIYFEVKPGDNAVEDMVQNLDTDRIKQINQLIKFSPVNKLNKQRTDKKDLNKGNQLQRMGSRIGIQIPKAPKPKLDPTKRLRKLQLFLLNQRLDKADAYQSILLLFQMFYLFENIRKFRRNLSIFCKKSNSLMTRYDIYH